MIERRHGGTRWWRGLAVAPAVAVAACAALTGLDDYELADEAGPAPSGRTDGSATPLDGASDDRFADADDPTVPRRGVRCRAGLICEAKVCCLLTYTSVLDAWCEETPKCSGMRDAASYVPYVCDDDVDCAVGEECCVQILTLASGRSNAGTTMSVGSFCRPRGACFGDAGAPTLRSRVSCSPGGSCEAGVCTAFTSASGTLPSLWYCDR